MKKMNSEAFIRFGFFLGIFLIMALWEILAPRRKLTTSKTARWTWNLTITVINPLLVRLLFPVLALGMAVKAQESHWGLLNSLELPYWVNFVLAIAALDLIIYLQHLMFHAVPLLWRLHMVHHADLDIDLTTGLRFHPIEIMISMIIKLSAMAILGPPPEAVVVFEVILNGMAMFNHGNVRLPLGLDRVLRLLVVTPDMHRVHHSIYPRETNSNFGFNLSWWDRLLGTYKAQPTDGHDGMTIGLRQFRDAGKLTLPRLLLMPFTGDQGKYAIGRRG
jgi:sterol desaturase/sphingolipid hydroxylase (fatty acid hydroxylase superfamily)